ncbi:MAG: BofC C-terminal domain-containing protein [Oscillospiraceae bacterium]|nr:BofC C-terminal domain-containing protein [Oscillospiraceae bacterium]
MKKIIFLCLGLSAVLLLCLFLPKTNNAFQNESSTAKNTYTVREFDGQIAIFSDDSEIPVKVFDTSVSALPKSDRELLELGITVETPEELQRIIEDFTG